MENGFSDLGGFSQQGFPEESRLALDTRLKKLMKELGESINETLSDSDKIGEVISRIKGEGYDVFLVLEATIGFNKRDGEDSEESETIHFGSADDDGRQPEFKVNSQDMRFLKSLRIKVDDAA